MTTATGNTRIPSPTGRRSTGHVLLHDDLGRFTLRRLRPWHRLLARCAAARLDRELAAGAGPETSALLAARAMQLTSMKFRWDLATSLQRILAAAGFPVAGMPSRTVVIHPPRIPLCRAWISRSAGPLAKLAGSLAAHGPVPVQGVAMVSQLLADPARTGQAPHARRVTMMRAATWAHSVRVSGCKTPWQRPGRRWFPRRAGDLPRYRQHAGSTPGAGMVILDHLRSPTDPRGRRSDPRPENQGFARRDPGHRRARCGCRIPLPGKEKDHEKT